MATRRVRELEGRLENKLEACIHLAHHVGEFTQELREIRRQIGLPSTSLTVKRANVDEVIDAVINLDSTGTQKKVASAKKGESVI